MVFRLLLLLVFLIIITCEQRQYNVFSIRSHPFSSFILSIFSLSSPSLSTRISSTSSNSNNIYYRIMNIDKPCYNSFCEPAATERRSKNSRIITDAHGVFDTDFFDLCFFSMHRDFRRICKRDRLRLVLDHEICRRPTDQREVISRIPRIYTGSQPKRFVRFVRLVFEKNISVY